MEQSRSVLGLHATGIWFGRGRRAGSDRRLGVLTRAHVRVGPGPTRGIHIESAKAPNPPFCSSSSTGIAGVSGSPSFLGSCMAIPREASPGPTEGSRLR